MLHCSTLWESYPSRWWRKTGNVIYSGYPYGDIGWWLECISEGLVPGLQCGLLGRERSNDACAVIFVFGFILIKPKLYFRIKILYKISHFSCVWKRECAGKTSHLAHWRPRNPLCIEIHLEEGVVLILYCSLGAKCYIFPLYFSL